MFRRDIEIKKIIVATGRTDMRKGIDGLVSIVRLNYGMNPLETGTIFLFCGRRKNKIKCLAFEGDGFSLSVKRVTDGSFSWPNTPNEVLNLTFEQYDRLITGFTVESTIKS
jgi:transposase